MLNSKTAILIFSRLPQTEARHKKITGNINADTELWVNLNTHVNKIAASTLLPIIKYNEIDQHGNSFAEKFTNAATFVFEEGYDNIIIIGSDCPDLKREHLIYATNKLANGNEIVAGPDKRGGIYLLGINRSAFNKEAFLKFSWQTRFLFLELKNYASTFKHSILTTYLQDVNSTEDALSVSSLFYCNKSWHTLIIALLQKFSFFYRDTFSFIKSYLSAATLALRAPPIL
jgi:glycosyltransferase A (GT-A) superfamily protein (DUF2064 family)